MLFGDHGVDLFDQRIAISAVDHAGPLYALAAGGGATQAMHPDLQKEGRGLGIIIQNFGNDHIFRYHLKNISFFEFYGSIIIHFRQNAKVFFKIGLLSL